MRALVRGDEVIEEKYGLSWIEWANGWPLTNPEWVGGPYTLIEDYIAPLEDEKIIASVPDAERNAEIAELKARLAALEDGL